MHTHRSQELRGGDGRAVAVQLDSTSQVKVTDLDWGDLAMAEALRILMVYMNTMSQIN
jgi:hypothetical protein